MVRHTLLRRNPKVYEDYFCHQAGSGIPVFVGGRSQRGRGIGSFFSGLGRMVMPWLKTGGKALLREGLGTGLQVAQDALSGKNFGEAMRDRAKEAGQRLLSGAIDHMAHPQQEGQGFRRRRRRSYHLPAPPGEPARKRIKRTRRGKRSQSRHKRNKKQKPRRRQRKRSKHSDIFA